jgi:hypothetical protein
LFSAYLISIGISRSSADLSNEREDRSMSALRQAKTALIAYAANEQWQLYRTPGTYFQPGALPCPDKDNDGDADCVGFGITPTSSIIGRVPWKTMGIDDLRDSSGERLWYALSHDFRKLRCPSAGCTTINSDTLGQLTVTGTAPATQVVAIVFAPGEPVQSQNRDPANVNNVGNYLEGSDTTTNPVNYTFTSIDRPSYTSNDRLLVITQAELMAAVEPVVAARIERDIKPHLQAYFNQWGACPTGLANPFQPGRFPFPAKFANPDPGTSGAGTTRPQSAYLGDTTQVNGGLLPITASLNYPWTAASGTATLIGGIAGSISGLSCNTVALPGWQCSFSIDSVDLGPTPANWGPCTDGSGVQWQYCMVNPSFAVQGAIGANAGKSFANLPDASLVTITDATGTPRPMSTAAINGTLTSAGVGTVIFKGTWAPSSGFSASTFSRPMVVTIPDVLVSALANPTVAVAAASNASPISITTSTPHGFSTGVGVVTISGVSGNSAANGDWTVTVADSTHFTLNGSAGNGIYVSGGTASSTAAWFIANEWFRQLYYAVSPGYLPGGGACNPLPGTPSCLTVNKLPPSYATSNDKLAILVLAGRALNGSSRPSGTPANYFENANLSAAQGTTPYVYEHRAGGPTSINDRVVVVSP